MDPNVLVQVKVGKVQCLSRVRARLVGSRSLFRDSGGPSREVDTGQWDLYIQYSVP